MLKNFLETKAGRNIIIGLAVLIVVVITLVTYSLMSGKPKETAQANDKTEQTQESKETIGRYNGTIYSGTWYSNRSDDMYIELDADGTYWASSWIPKGEYYLKDQNIMVLEAEDGKTKEFQLQTRMGSTVMYLKEGEEEIFLYPNEDIKQKMESENAEQIEAAEKAVNQMWSDILTQGHWENKNSDRTFKLEFKDGEYVQTKIEGDDEETETFKYTISGIVTEQSGATISLSRTDSNDRKQDINFKITEEGSKYILAGPVGTFKWNSYYEKKYDGVTLTQDGTTRDDLPERTIETTDEEGNKVIITERDVTS